MIEGKEVLKGRGVKEVKWDQEELREMKGKEDQWAVKVKKGNKVLPERLVEEPLGRLVRLDQVEELL